MIDGECLEALYNFYDPPDAVIKDDGTLLTAVQFPNPLSFRPSTAASHRNQLNSRSQLRGFRQMGMSATFLGLAQAKALDIAHQQGIMLQL